jgi:hypothetical protein
MANHSTRTHPGHGSRGGIAGMVNPFEAFPDLKSFYGNEIVQQNANGLDIII